MSNIKDELTPATLLVTISVVILFAILRYKLRVSSKNSPPLPPGPRSLPIVGYLPFLKADLPKQFTNMARIYGPIFKFYIGNKLHVVISAPELVKEVSRDMDDIFSNRFLTISSSVVSFGGQDIAFSHNWRKLRKIFVQEFLSIKNLEACTCFRKDEVRKTVKNVFGKLGTTVDVRKIAILTEANILRRMVWEDSTDLGAELEKVTSKITELLGRPNLSDFFPLLAWLDLQGLERALKIENSKLDRIYVRMIEDRIKYNSIMLDDGFGDEKKKDLLQTLLKLKDKDDATSLNITQIKAILSNVIFAGTTTTVTLIEWAMAEIIKNCNVMKRIQEELADVVGVNNIVEESHLPKLQYLDATIKETFRLHPVSPFLLPRVPSQECKVGGYTIPKGSIVFLNVYSLHRDPRYWDNALEFNPERFLINEGTNKCDYIGNNFKFIPFGSGRRVCPGIPLADKIQMYMLASLLHSFDWNLPEGEEHDLTEKFGITLKKSKPLLAIPSQRLHDVRLYA
ncbi:labd-13Z-ene-9,15,16-triol synthase, chloroplastic-like [Rutidosis leptorrhynchoides]|uniref:labd-13Z-ene-9,15,16-triol synthase, chloroplastic-like n=1 Tax=Rutidosis leptorrhynchoides TaxID=125765 RepID=UPI003A98E3C6